MAQVGMPVAAASSALEQHVGDALQFARAFGQQASFTVRFVSQDKKNGEKLRSMSAEELTSQDFRTSALGLAGPRTPQI